MTIEKVEHREDRSVFSIHEPTRNGELDIFREVTVLHDPREIAKLPTITPEQIRKLPQDYPHENVSMVDSYEKLPNGVMLVFIRSEDCDYYSNTYRPGCHSVSGPFRLVEDEVSPSTS